MEDLTMSDTNIKVKEEKSKVASEDSKTAEPSFCYCMVNNIPSNFRTGELRNFFSEFIESEKFDLFHFRHRPQLINISASVSECDNDSFTSNVQNGKSDKDVSNSSMKRCCCLTRFNEDIYRNQFIKRYNGKFWMDKEGNDLPIRCIITKVNLSDDDLQRFSLKELSPPNFMPRGNVGTPNGYFLDLIKSCRLPPSLIKKLDLEFPRARKYKKYSKVPMDYGTTIVQTNEDSEDEGEIEIKTGKGHEISDVYLPKSQEDRNDVDAKEESDAASNADDDDDRCEEWERHEALHDHRTTHGDMNSESKERLYETEIELQWEKGGPGIVWYTDAQFWDQQRGGFEERCADDWDVDMEGYYDLSAGDKDFHDMMDIRRSQRVQKGLETISVIKKNSPKDNLPSKIRFQAGGNSSRSSTSKGNIGEFEKHTRGIGRKVMEKCGWKDGDGLGSTIKGIPDALENEGQGPGDKRGFGYYGEKLDLGNPAKRRREFKHYDLESEGRIVIGTIYDKPEDLDIPEPLKRRNAPTFIKRYEFSKGISSSDKK